MVLSYSFLDLHAGTGSMTLGFLRAGFRCLGVLEENKRAAVILRENFPPLAAPLLGAGPREGDPARLPFQGGLLEERPDVVVGTPLRRSRGEKRARARIFGTYAAIRHLKPKAALLLFPAGSSGLEALNYLGALLMEEGYQIHPAKLDGAWYGLPEKEEVLALLALGEGVPAPLPGCWPPPRLFQDPAPPEGQGEENLPPGIQVPPPPRKAPYRPVTERQALDGLPPLQAPASAATAGGKGSREPQSWFGKLMRSWIPLEGPPTGHDVPARPGGAEGRLRTLREKARLRSLPDGFHLLGSPRGAETLIRESVPPLLALVLARAVRSILDGTLPGKGLLPEARGETAPLPEIPFPPRETRRPAW